MEWITELADAKEVLDGRFVNKYYDEIEKFASNDLVVDLFDQSTWGDADTRHPLAIAVLEWIGPHAMQQQFCENGVQTSGNVGWAVSSYVPYSDCLLH
jgi:hypothetical protein